MATLEEKFDGFRTDVIDRLARIETRLKAVATSVKKINGKVAAHEREIQRAKGAAALIGLLGGLAASLFSRWFGKP